MLSDDHCKYASADAIDNATLVVEGIKIVVSKSFLSFHSPYFKTLFYDDFAEKDQSKIELNDTKYNQFKELLDVIFPKQKAIDKDNIVKVLEYAERYEMAYVLKKCKSYVLNTTGWIRAKKLLFAEKNNWEDVKTEIVSQLTLDDLKSLMYFFEYNQFSNGLKVAILDRLIKSQLLKDCGQLNNKVDQFWEEVFSVLRKGGYL